MGDIYGLDLEGMWESYGVCGVWYKNFWKKQMKGVFLTSLIIGSDNEVTNVQVGMNKWVWRVAACGFLSR